MDPFMERRWQDLHSRLIPAIADQLQDQPPRDLVAQLNERVVMEFASDEPASSVAPRSIYPDVGVRQAEHSAAVATLPAQEVGVPDGELVWDDASLPETQSYVEIVDADTMTRIVTIIELISPTNKLAGKGRDSYLAKQSSTLRGQVNLVEIDLTRTGDRAAIFPWTRKLRPPLPTYLAGVWRMYDRKQVTGDYYALPLEQPLKPINIPLRPQASGPGCSVTLAAAHRTSL
jgi:hypothetical protein